MAPSTQMDLWRVLLRAVLRRCRRRCMMTHNNGVIEGSQQRPAHPHAAKRPACGGETPPFPVLHASGEVLSALVPLQPLHGADDRAAARAVNLWLPTKLGNALMKQSASY